MAKTQTMLQAAPEAATPAGIGPASRPGIYYVRLDPCPRRIVETGLPAGPAAEAVAREMYLRGYDLLPRPGRTPSVELVT